MVQRRWLTENFGLQGGFGYSENEESKERDVAVGVGFVLTYGPPPAGDTSRRR